jgi:hypothetical protein
MIVVDGEIDVECGENLAKAHLTGPGEFWVARAGSPGLGRQGWVALFPDVAGDDRHHQ